MKPVLVFAAMASIVCYALYGHREWSQAVEKLHLSGRTVASSQKQLLEFQTQERDQEDEIVLLRGKLAEVQNNLARAKVDLANFLKASAPVVAQQPVAPPPKPVESRPGPSLEQMMNRKNEIGLTYRVMILPDGTILKDVTVSKIGNGLITYNSPTGEVTVKKDNLPAGMVDKFGLNFDETPIPGKVDQPTMASSSGTSAEEVESATSFGVPIDKQTKVIGETTPFGFEVKDPSKDADNSTKESGNVSAIISELHARATQLRSTANSATDPSEAQQLRDKANKFDQQADDLKASLGG